MKHLADIGLIGLAVMGENLALNMESKGHTVAVYNRTVPGIEEGIVERFVSGRGAGKQFIGCTTMQDFVNSLAAPRKVFMMVRAGAPVDQLMEQLFPLLSPGDILIDGGNSNFEDTTRRVETCEQRGLLFVGAGVSGGEYGALHGPSIMPGGSAAAWPEVKPILQSIAAVAEDGTPCCQWVGPAGAGHFVKMIHNGIEYGDMQLISEAYYLMKHLLGMDNDAMAATFEKWNQGRLKSYLIEITAQILRHKDDKGDYLVDHILDTAGQKGTGKWSVINAMELGMPLGLIAAAVFERSLSAEKELRTEAAQLLGLAHTTPSLSTAEQQTLLSAIEQALYAAKLVSYAQGFAVLQQASDTFSWSLNMATIARLWREGCIIRSAFLNDIAAAYEEADGALQHLLFAPIFTTAMQQALPFWRHVIIEALALNVSTPALSAAIHYFLSLTTERLPANLLQAQRDFFGAHTFERTDAPRGTFFHENWTGQGGTTHAGSYNV